MKATVQEKTILVRSVPNYRSPVFISELKKDDEIEIDISPEFGDFYKVISPNERCGYIPKSSVLKIFDADGNEMLLTENEFDQKETLKERHGCVTAWLVLMIVANSIVTLVYLFKGVDIAYKLATSNGYIIMLAILAVFQVVSVIALLNWKKWGFWCILFINIIALIINIQIGIGIGSCLGGLIGLAILYGILQIKKEGVTAWDNLE